MKPQAPPPATLSAAQARSLAHALAVEHGFALSGIVHIAADGRAPRADALERWLQQGLHGPLDYMLETQQTRSAVSGRFPWAKSILMLGAFYDHAPRGEAGKDLVAHVARYARGRDYHIVFERRLKTLSNALIAAGVCTRAHRYVDYGPVLERAWAEAAGLGWIGKNTCLIHPRLGSFFLLAELILDSAPAADEPTPMHCGTCTACLDACPTQAFTAPGVLDASRCIVTWNIEQQGATPQNTWPQQREWVAGCDICQTVCPFNAPQRAIETDAELATPLPWQQMTISDAITMDQTVFDRAFPRSTLRRTGVKGVRLGAITVAGNLKLTACRAALEQVQHDADAQIRERAAWALARCAEAS